MAALPPGRAVAATLLLRAALGFGVGCVGGDSPSDAPAAVAGGPVVPADLLAQSWMVRLSDDTLRAPFEGNAAWGALFQRDLPAALSAFAADPTQGRGLARVHYELAALHEQAALLAANSTLQVYGEDRQDVDPAAVAYLLAAARGLTGDCAGAGAALAELPSGPAVPPALAPGLAFWKAQVAAGCPATLDLAAAAALPGAPGAVIAGQLPDAGTLPHYRLVEQSEEQREVAAGDPTTLALLAEWHRQAAHQVAPEADGPTLDQRGALWEIRDEAPALDVLPTDDALLFADFLLLPADAAFLADARSRGVPAVADWAGQSALAAALVPAIQDGVLVPEIVLDQAAALGKQLLAAMSAVNGGSQGFHEPFAELARVGLLRAGMVVADGSDQYRDAGILRINALERSSGPAGDPVFIASVAAWDAGNRNPLRAQEIIHKLVGRYTAVGVARYPLDAMHIRLSRNAAPATPVH